MNKENGIQERDEGKENKTENSSQIDSSLDRSCDVQKATCLQIIKSVWTHEPWLFFKVVVKSNDEMGDYIALHGLVPQNELPLHIRNKIPVNEIWIRENVYADVTRRKSILAHEYAELDLMVTQGLTYKEAHAKAEFIEHLYYPVEPNLK